MSAFDRLRRKHEDADKAEHERKKKEEAKYKIQNEEYRKYEGLVVGVLKKMYKVVYQPRVRGRPGHETYFVGVVKGLSGGYGIYHRAGLGLEGYNEVVIVWLGTDDNGRATHFVCDVSGRKGRKSGLTSSLNKADLEELLAKLYEESGGY